MSLNQEIQAAIRDLSDAEIDQIRRSIDDHLEDHLELSDEVKSKLNQARAKFTAPQL